MSPEVEPLFRASVTHGARPHVHVPVAVVFNVAALAPGWCELTTDVVPHAIFDGISVGSRGRLILPQALQPWYRGWETTQTLCLVQAGGRRSRSC